MCNQEQCTHTNTLEIILEYVIAYNYNVQSFNYCSEDIITKGKPIGDKVDDPYKDHFA